MASRAARSVCVMALVVLATSACGGDEPVDASSTSQDGSAATSDSTSTGGSTAGATDTGTTGTTDSGTAGTENTNSSGGTAESSVGTSTGATSEGTASDSSSTTGAVVECEACSLSEPASLNDGANVQVNPGRDVSETGDGRAVAGSHYYADEHVTAAVFDPVALTWEAPVILRDVGEWDAEEYTVIEIQPAPEGAVLFEDVNGRLFAHLLQVDAWSSFELTDVPEDRRILDAETGPDGRVAVLVQSGLDMEPTAVYIAYFDVDTGGWSASEPIFDNPDYDEIWSAEVVFDTADGDVLVALWAETLAVGFDWLTELHHFDAQTNTWATLYSAVEDAQFGLRELGPGEFAFSPGASPYLTPRCYFFSEEAGLSEETDVPFPSTWADGTMTRAWYGFESYYGEKTDLLNYHTYTRDDPVGIVDSRDVYVAEHPIHLDAGIGPHMVVAADRAYAFWHTYGDEHLARASIHDEDGWSDPITLDTHPNEVFWSDLAVNEQGDAVAAWSPECNGPCDDDPTIVAGYSADADCWQTFVVDDSYNAYAYPFSFTPNFAITTVSDGHLGRILACD